MIDDIFKMTGHPKELAALLKIKFSPAYRPSVPAKSHASGDYIFCYHILNKVSRSFAVVIRQLPPELRDATCVFYLVLRGLDTIEDDMSLDEELKVDLLKNFHKKLEIKNWNIRHIGDSEEYRTLLEQFDKVIRTYQQLDAGYRDTISSICRKMGYGMTEFLHTPIKTKAQYDLYCHYVAGLVGQGLSALFAASRLEDRSLNNYGHLSNSMGLFLQKTNITRDYFEDIPQNRIFWPEEIWKKHAQAIKDFSSHPEEARSVAALNEMVIDAFRHLPDVIQYLGMLENKQVFRFCAIPQIMAIATLAKLYNNPRVFTENVKIRKGLAAKYMVYTNDYVSFCAFAFNCISEIQDKLLFSDPNYATIHDIKEEIHRALLQSQALKKPYYG